MREATTVSSRRVDSSVVSDFLARAAEQPCALVVEGEAGIGKTTFWLAVLERAVGLGFRVLSARPAAAEAVLAYTSLADLLSGVNPGVWANLPEPQRLAIDRVTLRASAADVATDQRAVAAGFVSVVEELAADKPVLLAIDDLQWLDPSSAAIVAFAARRVVGPVGILAAVRLEHDTDNAGWLRLSRPDAIHRIGLPPMGLGELHQALTRRLGQSFSRPTLVRIHEISGGNPFYAIELGRAIATEAIRPDTPLPGTLAELVRARLGALRADVQEVLLAAACNATPTVEVLVRALDAEPDRLTDLLDDAQSKAIVALDGNRVRFTHPLLAHGVYTSAPASSRRAMHKRMAAIIDEPEVRARHLALAAAKGDAATLESLDAAAEIARIRGAPAAAAELLDLAIGLGGDTHERRIRSAAHHFSAGGGARARAMLEQTIDGPAPARLRAEALRLLGLWSLLEGSSRDAAGLLERALDDAGEDIELRAQILVPLAFALVNVRHRDRAAQCAEVAVRTATDTGKPDLLSLAIGMRVMVRFLLGHGVDLPALQRSLELEDRNAPVSALLNPTLQSAVLHNGTGQLDQARKELLALRSRYIERGAESELMIVAFHRGLNAMWRGDFAEAALVAEDAVERALLLDRDLPRAVALMLRGAVAAYAGDEQEARPYALEAFAICERCDSPNLVAVWPVAALGFLDVSMGNYDAALSALDPQLSAFDGTADATEIYVAPFLPDAVEALIQLGRAAEAEPLIDALERNGRRLDRPWMLALGARGRGMLSAARGDLDAAAVAARRAMAEHDRLPMPFERARSQLFLGQIQRRQRQKDVAASTLGEALGAFDALGTPLWAQRAREELQRVKVGPQQSATLSASEQRVAELAASGMTNREIAAALFISPKTVESNIARVYRKLGIRTRAELGQHMAT